MPRPRPSCLIDDCTRRHHARGYCVKHYRRIQRKGTPDDLPTPADITRPAALPTDEQVTELAQLRTLAQTLRWRHVATHLLRIVWAPQWPATTRDAVAAALADEALAHRAQVRLHRVEQVAGQRHGNQHPPGRPNDPWVRQLLALMEAAEWDARVAAVVDPLGAGSQLTAPRRRQAMRALRIALDDGD